MFNSSLVHKPADVNFSSGGRRIFFKRTTKMYYMRTKTKKHLIGRKFWGIKKMYFCEKNEKNSISPRT